MVATRAMVGDWVADSEGVYGFTIADTQGLSDGVAVKRGEVRREGGHGSFDTPVWLDSRIVSLSGKCWARSPQELHQYGVVLRGLGASGDRFKVVFDHAGETFWGWARRAAQPLFDERPALKFADWQYDFWMPDPYLYGATRETVSAGDSVTFGNTVAAHHRGNTAAHPTFTVTATSSMTSGYQIKGKGRTFEVPGPLNVGSTDKVDMATGTVRRNGTLVTGVIADGFEINGGESADWRLWPLSGAGSATMHLLDTFA